MNTPIYATASLSKRLLALAYDVLLVFGICMAVAALYTMGAQALVGDRSLPSWILQLTLLPCLLLAAGSFYSYCWYSSGQTLGMQTWRIKVVSVKSTNSNGVQPQKLSLGQCCIRFAGAWLSFLCLGCGFLILLGANRETWHDRWSNTQVQDLTKRIN